MGSKEICMSLFGGGKRCSSNSWRWKDRSPWLCGEESIANIPSTSSGSTSWSAAQKCEMKMKDYLHLLEPHDSNTTTSINGGQKERKDSFSSSSSSSSTSSSSSSFSPSLKWVVCQWVDSIKRMAAVGGREGSSGEGVDVGCWVPSLRRRGRKKGKGKERRKGRKVVCLHPSSTSSYPGSLVALPEVEEVPLPLEEAEAEICDRKEISIGNKSEDPFNLGFRVGLVYLLARSASEFNKMKELRKEMETVLKDMKDTMQRKDAISNYEEPKNSLTLACTEESFRYGNSSSCLSFQNPQPSSNALETQFQIDCDDHLNCEADSDNNGGHLRMDQLERELALELEQLQLNLEIEDTEHFGNRIEALGDNNNPLESYAANFREETDTKNGIEEEEEEVYERHQYSVSPHELERKLHEVLEARQQEHITELESALQCVQRKLREKETEIWLWRDMARLVHSGGRKSC